MRRYGIGEVGSTRLNGTTRRCAAGAASLAVAGLLNCAQANDYIGAADEGTSASSTRVSTLQPVVVTATASPRSQADTPASVSVIEGEDLRRKPMSDLGDAVKDTVGVAVEGVGLGRRGVSIRGMRPDHTLMLVNGQRLSASSSAITHSDFELGWVPAAAIERVEVVRGPMSSLYGSDALGGVVNVITRRATDHWEAYGSSQALVPEHGWGGDQWSHGFYLGGPLVPDRFGLNVWGELGRSIALEEPGTNGLTLQDSRTSTTGHVGISWMPDSRQRMGASVDMGSERRVGIRAGSAEADYESVDDVKRQRYVVSHRGRWGWGESQIHLYRTSLHRENRLSHGGTGNGPNRLVDTVIQSSAAFSPSANHSVTFGGELRRERLDDPSVNLRGSAAQTHSAVFVQDEILLGERWDLVLGGRFDRHDTFGNEFSPRAYLLFHPEERWTLRAGIGRGFKAPTLKQLSSEFESRAAIGGRGIIRGNPSLQPETNQSIEFGAEYRGDSWFVSGTLFHNDVENLIDTVRQPTCYERGRVCLVYENIAQARIHGAEIATGFDLSPAWRLEANYTYLNAIDRTTGERLSERAKHRANAALEWAANSRVKTRVQFEYTGRKYRSSTEPDAPAYALVHWYIDYEWSPAISVYGGVENLADKRLAMDDHNLYSDADMGRRYFLGLSARF